MSVAINEARENDHVREVNYCRACGNFYGFSYFGDVVVADQDYLIGEFFAGVNIQAGVRLLLR